MGVTVSVGVHVGVATVDVILCEYTMMKSLISATSG